MLQWLYLMPLFVFQCGLSVTRQITSKIVATGKSIIPIQAICTYSNILNIFLAGWKNLLVLEVKFKRVAASHDSSGFKEVNFFFTSDAVG